MRKIIHGPGSQVLFVNFLDWDMTPNDTRGGSRIHIVEEDTNPPGGASPYNFAKFSKTLHEIGKILGPPP